MTEDEMRELYERLGIRREVTEAAIKARRRNPIRRQPQVPEAGGSERDAK